MSLYKLINAQTVVKFGNPLYLPNGTVISNPTKEMAEEMGFKELIKSEIPKTEHGRKMIPNYYEFGGEIKQIWVEDISEQRSEDQ